MSKAAGTPKKVPPDQTARLEAEGWMRERSVVAGDTVRFKESVYRGRYRRGAYRIGNRVVIGHVLRDSYGAKSGQHTFSVKVISCEGKDPIAPGTLILRKGRVMYRNVRRKLWADETKRLSAAEEKYARAERAYEAVEIGRKERRKRWKEARRAERERQAAQRESAGQAA